MILLHQSHVRKMFWVHLRIKVRWSQKCIQPCLKLNVVGPFSVSLQLSVGRSKTRFPQGWMSASPACEIQPIADIWGPFWLAIKYLECHCRACFLSQKMLLLRKESLEHEVWVHGTCAVFELFWTSSTTLQPVPKKDRLRSYIRANDSGASYIPCGS